MAAILQALFCAGIFIMIGFVYRPDPESRYPLGVSVIAFALGFYPVSTDTFE